MKKYLKIVFFICAANFANSQTILHKELLGKPTDNSITIQMIFAQAVDIRVEYGTNQGVYSNQTNWQTFADSIPAEITINGLTADTKYYYRINYKSSGSNTIIIRPEYHFQTQRLPGSSFTFVVQADPHLDSSSDTSLYNLCLKNQLEDNPDFMIDLGDFIMTDKLKNINHIVPKDTIPYRCNLLRSHYENSTHSVPLYIALGNHEGEAGWYLNGTANNIAVWDSEERMKYFLNPSPNSFYTGDTTNNQFVGQRENYYAWTWGDALFIVLDPYWYTNPKPDSLNGWRWTLGKVQYDWLKSTLENSNSKFKFVFSHQIIGGDPEGRGGVEFADRYEWGGDNLDGTPGFSSMRPGWYKPIKDLLTENKVNIFFHGHDHFFGKQEKDCLIYQETPQPSLPIFGNASMAADYGYFAGQILPNAGHLRVNVSPNGVQVDYVRVYTPQYENTTRHNKDISATYFIGSTNCYDSLSTGVPIIWNSNYSDELVHPNPFDNETQIDFTIDQEEVTNLSIYNSKGELVRQLINNSKIIPGKYQIIWDGKDKNNNLSPSGQYNFIINGSISGKRKGQIVKI